jgi:beta-phosphoglucomutase-like phosphatase (HAD superfamily)
MKCFVLFLDDGGVISDNSVRGPQWQRLVSEFFPPILGGEPQAWADANRVVINAILEPAAWQARLKAATDYRTFEDDYYIYWLGEMCRLVGIPRPPDEESIALSRQASTWITRQVRADFPGVVDTIRLLHERGYMLHTASGESSADLEAYLGTMGVLGCFGNLYGPDLVDTFKVGPEFYERMFDHAAISADDALVVDDSPLAVSWASQAGAHTVLVGAQTTAQVPRQVATIGSLAELPGLIEELG